ncbi:MAG TPA: GGDEF domain-containing protein, partial [Gemmatimonadaceae bacterium]|nr:GGDEF domain-containing protein [Gemmatimonadaceae bacterium]
AVRAPAFFGRLGGEEFLVVLPATSLDGAFPAADRFREQIMAVDTSRWFPARRRITASIGVTCALPGACTSSTMLMRADAALYAAKRAGRNCVKTAPSSMEREDTEPKIA